MMWTEVKTFLEHSFIGHATGDHELQGWIDGLEASTRGKVLGICIAIDVKSGAVSVEKFRWIFDRLDFANGNSCESFSKALETHPDRLNFLCSSRLPSPALPIDDHYWRVLELKEFITYYLGSDGGYLSLAPSSIRSVRKRYFIRCRPLGHIQRWWTGVKPVVWVSSQKELRGLYQHCPRGDHGSIVNDALGLGLTYGAGPGNRAEIVAVRYPKNFSIGCTQPTTLDANWEKPTFYLSVGAQNGWGKSQSCSGRIAGVGERVHSHFRNLTDEYTTDYIGVADPPLIDYNALLTEGLKRFSCC